MRIVICNFGPPNEVAAADPKFWDLHPRPEAVPPLPLFSYKVDWGFHIYALGLYLREIGVVQEVEFWNFVTEEDSAWQNRGMSYHYTGVLNVNFLNAEDVKAYVDLYGAPDIIVNHGRHGMPVLKTLEGRSFRVHVAALRHGLSEQGNHDAECYLVDAERFLDEHSMLYIPVVHTQGIRPSGRKKQWDFIYLASVYAGKRHDIVINAVRDTTMTGHFHPVAPDALDLSGTHITTSNLDEGSVPDLLNSSRIAVYPGDVTSNPAAMWECVASGLPIVMNRDILGGKHLVVPGVTGELANEDEFAEVMKRVIDNHQHYSPRAYFEENWDTVKILAGYLRFFREQGFPG